MPGLMWRTLRRDMRSPASRSSSFAPTAVPLPRHLPGRSGVTRACGPTACAEHHHAVLGDQASGSRWARYSGQAGRQTGRQTGRQAGWLEYYKLGYPRLDRRPMTWQEKGKQGRGTRGWEGVGVCTSGPTPLFSAPPPQSGPPKARPWRAAHSPPAVDHGRRIATAPGGGWVNARALQGRRQSWQQQGQAPLNSRGMSREGGGWGRQVMHDGGGLPRPG